MTILAEYSKNSKPRYNIAGDNQTIDIASLGATSDTKRNINNNIQQHQQNIRNKQQQHQ